MCISFCYNVICVNYDMYGCLCVQYKYNINLYNLIVKTRFVTTHNSVGFVRKKAQTISFVERGFERLGFSHQTVGFSWCSYMVRSFSP